MRFTTRLALAAALSWGGEGEILIGYLPFEQESAMTGNLAVRTETPTPFVWSKTADEILEDVASFTSNCGVSTPTRTPSLS